MKISLLLSASLFVFSMNLVSAKETPPLMLSSVNDNAFSTHASVKQIVAMTNQAMFADSLRALAVDVSLDKGGFEHPVVLKAKQPSLGGETF